MVYDSQSNRFVLFGGWDGASGEWPRGFSEGTWSYDLEHDSWSKMNAPRSPLPRAGSAAAYDSRADRIILFGGSNGSNAFRETWTYDLEADAWVDRNPSAQPPGGAGGMAFDSESEQIVLLGGPSWGPSETWAYDLSANTWTNMSPVQGITPPIRRGYSIAYDSESDRTILFGGSILIPYPGGATERYSNETWAYDYNTNTWTNMQPVTAPSSRHGHALSYDIRSDRIILFAGFTGTGINDETWTYDFDQNLWSLRSPTTKPSGRTGHSMAYDARLDGTLLFGGRRGGELWSYELARDTWTPLGPPRPPNPFWTSMAYDGLSDRVILFGGTGSGQISDQTWAYDLESNRWTRKNPATQPPPRVLAAMAYDSQADRTILFGGVVQYPHSGGSLSGDTWAYDFETDTWTAVESEGPSPRMDHAMAYDSESDRLILFGGVAWDIATSGTDETWVLDYTTGLWTNMSLDQTERPSNRSGHTMAYDAQSDRIVLFGGTGTGPHNDTWVYDFNTNTWTSMTPVVSPSVIVGQAMTYDPVLHRVILSGMRETWAYDFETNTWTNMTGTRRSIPTREFGMVYDAQSGRTVLYGGSEGVSPSDRTFWGRPVSVPSSPRGFTLNGSDGRVTLGWQAPLDDGGAPVEAYRIYRGMSRGGASFLAEVGPNPNYSDTAVTNGIVYYYQVSAINEAGEGPRSEEMSASPTASPPPSDQALLFVAIAGGAVSIVAAAIAFSALRRRRRGH